MYLTPTLNCSDVTGATWGGSTVQSDPDEDETSSTSLPSQVEANITQDSVLDNMDRECVGTSSSCPGFHTGFMVGGEGGIKCCCAVFPEMIQRILGCVAGEGCLHMHNSPFS